MRRSILGSLLVLAMLTPAASARAETWTFGVQAGVGVPGGDFGDYWGNGLLFGGTVSCMVNDMWAFGVDASMMKNDPSDDYQADLDLIGGEDEFSFTQFGAHAKWMLPTGGGPIVPYFIAGVGLYSMKEDYSEPGFSAELTNTAFGVRGGVGAMWKLTPAFALGAELDYHHVMPDEDEIGHDSAPFIGIKGGLHFMVPQGGE